MNTIMENILELLSMSGFRPQQGLTIMNNQEFEVKEVKGKNSFRPQQGLTIMNPLDNILNKIKEKFPSPTGVNYYE